MNNSDHEDTYDSSVYSDDDDESFTKYNEEEEEEYEYEDSHDEFFYNPKKENDIPVEFVPQVTVVDTKIPEINPWTRKKNNEDEYQEPVFSMSDIIKQEEYEKKQKALEMEKNKKTKQNKPTSSILLNRKDKNNREVNNNKISGFKKRTFNYKATSV
jgi:hypothetical protein